MTTGTPYVTDPIAVDVGGVIAQDTPAQAQAAAGNQTITPTANFGLSINGCIVSFIAGHTVDATPDLVAALTAAGAPFTQP